MKIPFVDLKSQYKSIQEEISAAISDVINNTAFIKGYAVENFERKFENAIGVKNCIGVANGTDALEISLRALGIKVGDEVIVPANSFIATSEAVSTVGAKVCFVDNDPNTYNLDYNLLTSSINSNTKAIIVVHLYGQPGNMDKVLPIAKKHNLFVIEDSAQAHLAEFNTESYGWKMTGTMGDIATFSFYPGKNLGAYGDAGAIVTNNDALAKKARMYANHGRISKYDHEFEGVNSRMDGIQGAVLGVKLRYLSIWTEKRRKAAEYYTNSLCDIDQLILPFLPGNCKPVWHLYVLRVEKRDDLMEYLKKKGISVGVHYPIALPNLQAYEYLNHKESDFPVASSYQKKLLSLPIFPEITKGQQDYVINSIKDFFNQS
jgi:dTDP-4-amino-4,6-dideoxygalactose transaminase